MVIVMVGNPFVVRPVTILLAGPATAEPAEPEPSEPAEPAEPTETAPLAAVPTIAGPPTAEPTIAIDDSFDGRATASEKRAALALAERLFRGRPAAHDGAVAANLFELKQRLPSNHSASRMFASGGHQLMHTLRVPKSGSSYLSLVGRALAGCAPDGFPCCKFPGDPEGSCPRKGLMCSRVRACTNHYPMFSSSEQIPIVTQIRQPAKRLVSAFFYVPPHRPKTGCHSWECFQRFIATKQFRNVLTRMLNGDYAYSPGGAAFGTAAVEKAKRRLCSQLSLTLLPIFPRQRARLTLTLTLTLTSPR